MDEDLRGNAAPAGLTQDELENLNGFAETGPFVQLTSEDAPGFAENGVTQPRSKTVGYLYRLAKALNQETPSIGDMQQFHDERLLISTPIGRTVIEFEKCRQTLKHTIKNCLKFDFLYVASAISCVLNSLRPLHTREVDTAVDLFVEYADSKHSSHYGDESVERTWLQRCRSFLVVDDAGLVHFTSGFMPLFLRQFRIRGIDATHQTIATACLIQVDLDDKSDHQALNKSISCFSADCSLAFSEYAEKYWREHCRSAEQSCQDLSAAACVVPNTGGLTVLRDAARRMATNANADLETIGIEHLTLGDDEEDEMDWVFVNGGSLRSSKDLGPS